MAYPSDSRIGHSSLHYNNVNKAFRRLYYYFLNVSFVVADELLGLLLIRSEWHWTQKMVNHVWSSVKGFHLLRQKFPLERDRDLNAASSKYKSPPFQFSSGPGAGLVVDVLLESGGPDPLLLEKSRLGVVPWFPRPLGHRVCQLSGRSGRSSESNGFVSISPLLQGDSPSGVGGGWCVQRGWSRREEKKEHWLSVLFSFHDLWICWKRSFHYFLFSKESVVVKGLLGKLLEDWWYWLSSFRLFRQFNFFNFLGNRSFKWSKLPGYQLNVTSSALYVISVALSSTRYNSSG